MLRIPVEKLEEVVLKAKENNSAYALLDFEFDFDTKVEISKFQNEKIESKVKDIFTNTFLRGKWDEEGELIYNREKDLLFGLYFPTHFITSLLFCVHQYKDGNIADLYHEQIYVGLETPNESKTDELEGENTHNE